MKQVLSLRSSYMPMSSNCCSLTTSVWRQDGRAPYGSTMHPSVSLHWKLTGHRSYLPSAGIPNLDGYNHLPLHLSKRKVKGRQLGSRTHRGQTFHIKQKLCRIARTPIAVA